MIDKLNEHYSMTNPASVYDEESLTALELAGRTTAKVNECVEVINKIENDTKEHLDKQDKSIPVLIDDAVYEYIQKGEFDEAIDHYAGELTERVNNIVANAGDDNTEVVDARVNAFGYTDATLGDSIRNQVTQLMKGTCKPNLIDLNALTPGFVQVSGEHHNSHQTGSFESWTYTTDFIPIELDMEYFLSIKHRVSRDGWYAISVYDANKQFINRDRTYNYTGDSMERQFIIYTDENAKYVRISYRAYTDAEIKFELSEYASLIEKRVTAINLIESYPLQFDGYIVTNGSIYPPTEKGEKYTRHIPVTPGEEYTLYNISASNQWYRVAFYDVNGSGINNISGSENKTTFEIPSNAVTMMVSARTTTKPIFGLFKSTSVTSPEQQVFENYIKLLEEKESATTTANNVDYDMYVKGIAHRGLANGDEIPENTASAFINAYNHGFKYVECDVRMTGDYKFVLCHDETIDRVSNGVGNVADMSLEEVKTYTVGNNETFLTLDEFLAICRRYNLKPYIELKGDLTGPWDDERDVLMEIIGCVIKWGMIEQTTILSFDLNVVSLASSLDSRLRVGLLCDSFDNSLLEDETFNILCDEVLRDNTKKGTFFVCVNYSTVAGSANNSTFNIMMYQIPLEVWTCDDESYILQMNPYITGVVSNEHHAGQLLHDNEASPTLNIIGYDEIVWKYEW